NPMAVIAGNQLPAGNALDQQAELYSQTHEIPSGLARSPGTIVAIINRAAQLHPDQNLGTNQARFKADQAALGKLQTNFDQVTAFENTAVKNLDVFLKQAKKLVDTGSPVLNTPLRAINEKVLGSSEQTAVNAARTTALTEISKVLNSANASGVL